MSFKIKEKPFFRVKWSKGWRSSPSLMADRHILLEQILEDKNENTETTVEGKCQQARWWNTPGKDERGDVIFQSVLYRMTPERFGRPIQQVKNLKRNAEERLNGAIEPLLDRLCQSQATAPPTPGCADSWWGWTRPQRAATHPWRSLNCCSTVASKSSWTI